MSLLTTIMHTTGHGTSLPPHCETGLKDDVFGPCTIPRDLQLNVVLDLDSFFQNYTDMVCGPPVAMSEKCKKAHKTYRQILKLISTL